MRLAVAILFAVATIACSPSQDEHAREQARRTAEQAKQDARQAMQDAKREASKASRELDEGLHKTRDKVRQALNEPDRKDDDSRHR
ncbi:MAG TPA: hypothetical protein VHB50_01155 [Bryobacteraceae bacterium]|nr:hypothetical protein [Bryobacteraceae bacterium]